MVINQTLNIPHNLSISLVCIRGHFEQVLTVFLVDGGRLGVEDEWHGQKALDG